ncbi:Histone acetyltransferase complex subunit [Physocladia obscura]|uniref:Histone acetyltransferase complex subunit n=1 Tax=Physocladia obscura TaxID=109957 RepID=A0AAD5T9N6_9FUNG|nr:Histone acetyltransferase complex subunit [Physocladia obscura]
MIRLGPAEPGGSAATIVTATLAPATSSLVESAASLTNTVMADVSDAGNSTSTPAITISDTRKNSIPLAPSNSVSANSSAKIITDINSGNESVSAANSTGQTGNSAPQQPPPLSTNRVGLDWKSGAEAVEEFPEQKEVFWKIVQMFGDCSTIADEKIALVERAKATLDKHIKRITATLEGHGVLPPSTAPPLSAAPSFSASLTPVTTSLVTGSSSISTPGPTPLTASLSSMLPPPPHLRAASQSSLLTPPSLHMPQQQASKFLSQRSQSGNSSTDILQKAKELAEAVAAESKAAQAAAAATAAAAAAVQDAQNQKMRGLTPDRNFERPASSAFGSTANNLLGLSGGNGSPSMISTIGTSGNGSSNVGHLFPSIPGSVPHTPHPLSASTTIHSLPGSGLSPNKKRLKRKIFEETGLVAKPGSTAESSGNTSASIMSATATASMNHNNNNNNNNTSTTVADADEDVYCICQTVSYGEMIGCDNPNCEKEWFHLECVALKAPPEGVWLCPECTAKKAAAAASSGPSNDLDDDDDLDADDGTVVKKSVFANVGAAASSAHKKKRCTFVFARCTTMGKHQTRQLLTASTPVIKSRLFETTNYDSRGFASATESAAKKPSGMRAAVLSTIPLAACTAAAAAVPEATWLFLEIQGVYSTALLAAYGGLHAGLVVAKRTSVSDLNTTSSVSGTGPTATVTAIAKKSEFLPIATSAVPLVFGVGSAVLLNVPGALAANGITYTLLYLLERAGVRRGTVPPWIIGAKGVATGVAVASIAGGLYLGRERDSALEKELQSK